MITHLGNKRLHNVTLASIGAMAYIIADMIHEAVGHGLTSLILGNKITLLTSVYFRSEPHSFITDAFGPILNLAAGLMIWVILKRATFSALYTRLLLILIMAFNFFWFSWMCIYSGISNKGDFAFYIPAQAGLILWRIFLTITGFFSYYVAVKLVTKRIELPGLTANTNVKELFSIPYWSAGIAALIAVSFYRPLLFNNFYEAFMFPMFLPTLFLAGRIKHRIYTGKEYSYKQQQMLIIMGIALFIAFCFVMGRGVKL